MLVQKITCIERRREAYSFMLRPIMAEEDAVFRCSSKAEADSAKRFLLI